MKQTILALALAVLPGAHAVTRQNHCYRQLHCYKNNTAEIAKGDGKNGGAATASGPNQGNTSDPFTLGNCPGNASGTSTYLDATGLFNAKGGLMNDGSTATATATADCVVPLTVANAKVTSASAATSAAEAAIKVAPTILVGKTYQDSECTTELSTNYVTLASLYVSDTVDGEEATAIAAGSATTHGGATADADGSQALTGDKVYPMGFTSNASPNTATGQFTAFHDWIEPLGTQTNGFPKLMGTDWSSGTYSPALAATDAATNVCRTFSANVAKAINAKKTANWMLPKGLAKAAGAEMSKAHKAIYYAESDSGNYDDAPGSVTATCKTTADASVVEVQYHKGTACGGTAPTWTPENATSAKVSCFPVRHIRHSTCKGTVACVNSAEAVLKHLKTEQADGKACGLAADAAPGKFCSKACQCPDKAKDLNWAVTKSTSDCWASSTKAGQVKVDLALYDVSSLTSIAAVSPHTAYATSTHGGLRKTKVDAVFDKYNSATSALTGTSGSNSICGVADVAEEAKAGDGKAKGYLAEHATLWTATGCGYTKPDSGGARAQYALSAIATLGALVGAALF